MKQKKNKNGMKKMEPMSREEFYERYERSTQAINEGNIISHEDVKAYFRMKRQASSTPRRCAE